MKKVTAFTLLVGIMVITGQVFAADYGDLVYIQGAGRFHSISSYDWSPDGKWIAFSASVEKTRVIDGRVVPERQNDIWIVSSEGGIPKNLTNGYYGDDYIESCSRPDFTHDSSEVTYSKTLNLFEEDGRRQEFTIESIDIHTLDLRVIVEKNSHLGFWSNDGRYLVYFDMTEDPVFDNKDQFALKVMEYDHNYEAYHNSFSGDGWPRFDFGISCFSHDNTHVLTTLLEKEWIVNDNPWALYKIPLDGGEPEKLISEGSPWYPIYSPDGKWILYTETNHYYSVSGDNYSSDQFFELCVYNVETQDIIKLLPDSEYWNFYGRWSPDGTQICYILRDDDQYELRIIDFEFAEEEIQVSVDDESPYGFALKGNYPNPFNPTTTIEFSLPEAGVAELTVYNLAGQKIRELLSGTMSAGQHSVIWNGCDDSGLTVSNGVYLARLRMNDTAVTGRMMLMK